MKLKTALLFALLFSNLIFSQNTIKLTANYGSENNDIQNLLDFDDIYIEQLHFEGENLKGKHYEISLQEFTKGKLTHTYSLFDTYGNDDYFKLKSNKESLKFFFKTTDKKVKIYVQGTQLGSKTVYFKLKSPFEDYALKDFFGSKKELNFDISNNQEIPLLALITPTIHKDGSSSYCEVAQSDIKPENFGTHFKIPHYFIITIKFK